MSASDEPLDADGDTIGVAIVDDHLMFAESLVRLLSDEPDFDVENVTGRIDAAVAWAAENEPDVVILDYFLPDGDGADAVRRVAAVSPRTKIVVISAQSDDATFVAAIEAGCDGFVPKTGSAAEVVRAVRTVYLGRAAMPIDLLTRALPRLRGGRERSKLTRRELEVVSLLAEGASSSEIATRLAISINTVRNHVQNLLTKLGAHSQLEAVAIAVREGIVTRVPIRS
jgi:DNA-binding NarL/FixJ family response regulator